MQWHQLDHVQTICTSLQTDNHTNTPGWMLFLTPNHELNWSFEFTNWSWVL